MKAFIIGRPFHLFNSINFVLANHVEADAFIMNEYKDARSHFDRVKEANVFRNVYFVEDSSLRPHNRLMEVLFAIERGLFPMRILLKAVQEPKITKDQLSSYTEIFSASPGTFMLSLSVVSNAKYYVLEDGAGTYSGKDFMANQSLKHRIYCKVFRSGALNLKVEGVYVYRPEMCNTELSDNILQLPTIDSSNSKLMEAYQKTFDKCNDAYRAKFILLSQRLLGLNLNMNLPKFIHSVFRDADVQDYCYRLHPAEAGGVLTQNEKFCLPSEMWELLCADYVDDDKVLITINSTAAFSPFKLYNKEPYVIFIYRVVGLEGVSFTISEDLVNSLKKQYSDPSKIFVANNRNELIDIIKKLNSLKSE